MTSETPSQQSPGLETLRPEYDWKSVAAMRDKMTHPYFGGFDYEFVWDAAAEDVPELRALFAELLEELSI